MELHSEDLVLTVFEAHYIAFRYGDMGRGEGCTVDGVEPVALVEDGDVYAAGLDILDRMVAVHAASHRLELRSVFETDDLLAEADAEYRLPALELLEEVADLRDLRGSGRAV